MAALGGQIEVMKAIAHVYDTNIHELLRKHSYLSSGFSMVMLRYWNGFWKYMRNTYSSREAQNFPMNWLGSIFDEDQRRLMDPYSLECRRSFWQYHRAEEWRLAEQAAPQLPVLQWICRASRLADGEQHPEKLNITRSLAVTVTQSESSQAPDLGAAAFKWLLKVPNCDMPHLHNPYFLLAVLRVGPDCLEAIKDWIARNPALAAAVDPHQPTTMALFDVLDDQGMHLVHYAASEGHLESLKWLAKEIPSFQGETGKKRFINLRTVIRHAAEAGMHVAHLAAADGHLEVLKWLKSEFDYPMDQVDSSGNSVLHRGRGHVEVVRWLCEEAGQSLTSMHPTGDPKHRAPLQHFAAIEDTLLTMDYIFSKLGPACLHVVARLGAVPVKPVQLVRSAEMLDWFKLVGGLKAEDFCILDIQKRNIAHLIAMRTMFTPDLDALAWLKKNTPLTLLEREPVNHHTVLALLLANTQQLPNSKDIAIYCQEWDPLGVGRTRHKRQSALPRRCGGRSTRPAECPAILPQPWLDSPIHFRCGHTHTFAKESRSEGSGAHLARCQFGPRKGPS
jgi:hypothetical protein